MIPKIIHYCWFGGKDLPEECKVYISQWQSLHPDWEIKQWDESNSPLELPYLQNALQHRKWANMSNMVRFHALLVEGGIYLDTDMKIIKPMTALLENQCFMGFEEGDKVGEELWVNNAIIGAEKENDFIKRCYEVLLTNFDGVEDANLSAPRLVTQILKEEYALSEYGFQSLRDVTLYPTPYFYPVHYNEAYKLENVEHYIKEETIAVHMWSRSWLTSDQLLSMLDHLQFKYDATVEKNHLLKETVGSIKHLAGSLLENDEDTGSGGDKYSSNNLESIEQAYKQKEEELKLIIENLQLEKSLLNKEVEVKEALLLAVNKTVIEQAEHYTAKELNFQSQIQLLKENSSLQARVIAQQQMDLEQKETYCQKSNAVLEIHKKELLQLQKVHAEMEETLLAEIRELKAEKENLNIALHQQSEQATTLSKQTETYKKETEELEAINKNLEDAINKSNFKLKELEMQYEALQAEYEEYRNKQEVNNRELIRFLEERRNVHQNNITWYKATYENRRLLGIIKDRLIKSIIK